MAPGTPILRLVGVYNAEGTLRGELTYWVGARLGSAHCALCDVTHGVLREKAAWRSCRATLAVPFDTYHLDDQPDEVRAVTAHVGAPLVVAVTRDGVVLLLGADELETCHGSPEAMTDRLVRKAEELGLVWS